VHIQKIAPIRHAEDYVWSLAPIAVITIGKMVLEGRYFTERIISLAGNGILEDKRGYFAGRMGMAIKNLAEDRLSICPLRLISGDPLSGQEVTPSDFLGFFDLILCAIPENQKREFFHFFRLGGKKFTATRTYLSGLFVSRIKSYPFTTNQHGEERAFVDSEIYHKVMPLRIPTVHLIKAILAKDYELAQELGLLEVVPEDFALSAFICPSKIEMVQIVKEGLVNCIREIGH
jgi:Na+-transporting NADH:ubiquinone oxidoreductase subunit A